MRIRVSHTTVYRYSSPVILRPHVFRLRPRHDGAQRLLHYRCAITPAPVGQSESLDHDGNVFLQAWFNGPVEELRVTSQFEVETVRHNPFDFLLAGEGMSSIPVFYPDELIAPTHPYRNCDQVSPPVREYASTVAGEVGGETIRFLTQLTTQIHQDIRQIVRPEGHPFASDVTLRQAEGSCRDLAILFADACRAVGFAARFVSGYELASLEHEDPYMHAWTEVYLPGGGWRGFDPSRGLVVERSHVAVAAAVNPLLATPIHGTFMGAAQSSIEARITMNAVETCITGGLGI
jgi:transglutaminase-like putative cysteine protease